MKKLILLLILFTGCSGAKNLPFAPQKKQQTISRMTKSQKKRSIKGKKFKPVIIDLKKVNIKKLP